MSRAELTLLGTAVRQFRGWALDPAYVDTPGALAFIATGASPTDVAGWCWGYHLRRPDSSSMLYLHELEVSDACRRTGVGRGLVRAFMTAGAEAGATKMFLTTGEANVAARALYDGAGGTLAAQGPTVNYWFDLSPGVWRPGAPS